MTRATLAELIFVAALAVALALLAPRLLSMFQVIELSLFASLAVLALSLSLVWGFGGLPCFGQAVFFGLGGYAYAIGAINFGDGLAALPLALAVPAAFAALLGLWSFWGRLSEVYFGVVTLTLTLILYKLMVGASGPAWQIGSAHLGGYNGLPGLPTLHWPGRAEAPLDPIALFDLALASLAVVYLLLRLLLSSRFGRVLVAVRENPLRAGLLGYDPRLYRLGALVLGGAIAGHAGMLYANWGAFVSPEMFSLATTVQIIAWVLVGGRASLPGAVIGCVGLQLLQARLGTQQVLDTNLILGGLLVLFVLAMPSGLVPALSGLVGRWRRP